MAITREVTPAVSLTTVPRSAVNRLAPVIALIRKRIADGGMNGALDTPLKRRAFEDGMAVSWEQHFAYQNAQSRAFASGRITQSEAQTVYAALGEVGSMKNGGWAKGTDLATKVAVTMFVTELLAR